MPLVRRLAAMPLARRRLAALTVLAGLLGTAGCGSSAASDGGVEPRTWAKSVCTALTPWRGEISALTAQAQRQMSSATTPQQAKENLVALLSGAERASETARQGVQDAGTPDVADGREIAARFTASLQAARDAYAHARTAVSGMNVSDPTAFYDGVAAAFGELQQEYAKSALDTGKVASAELRKAFGEVPECR